MELHSSRATNFLLLIQRAKPVLAIHRTQTIMNTSQLKRPWYREPWVWLMIAFPLSAVIGGVITIYLAVVTSDGLVVDDYYKRGKAINRVLARDVAAARYQLKATIDIDLRDNRVRLLLESAIAELPEMLTFSLLHPTRPGHDQVIILQHAGEGVYSGAIDELARSKWYLQLETDDWRLSGSMQIPRSESLVLVPVEVSRPE